MPSTLDGLHPILRKWITRQHQTSITHQPSAMYNMFTTRAFIPAPVPRPGLVISMVLSIVSSCVLAVCLSRRMHALRRWRTMRLTHWLTLAIYFDSILFVSATAVLSHGFGLNSSAKTCSAAILLCLLCYMSTKILIYYMFVEKVNVVNAISKRRLQSKLYIFNCFGMMLPYCIVVVLNFIFRIAKINEDGMCIIGMEKKAMMPLIIFDVIVNVYLTVLFIIPLRKQYTYKSSNDNALRTVTFRTFMGSLATLISSVINLTILMVLEGEPAWICLMCCNADILFSVVVLHWVTSKDKQKGSTVAQSQGTARHCNSCNSVSLNEFNQKRGGTGERASVRNTRSNVEYNPNAIREDDEEQMIPDSKGPENTQVISVTSDISVQSETPSVKSVEVTWSGSVNERKWSSNDQL